jgi:hypothetical protein
MQMQTLTEIQDEYIATVNAGLARWSHRKDGGHSSRILRGAYHKAKRELHRLGMDAEQIKNAIRDARDMAELERNAE